MSTSSPGSTWRANCVQSKAWSGPRRAGKTTLLRNFLNQTTLRYKLDSGDNIRTQQLLSSQDFSQILAYVEGYELLAIDEAQGIPNIGMALKIIVDQAPGIRVLATGSSSFELAGQVGEPSGSQGLTLGSCGRARITSTGICRARMLA